MAGTSSFLTLIMTPTVLGKFTKDNICMLHPKSTFEGKEPLEYYINKH